MELGEPTAVGPAHHGARFVPEVRPGWSNVVYEAHRVKGPTVCFTLPAWLARAGAFASRVALVARGR